MVCAVVEARRLIAQGRVYGEIDPDLLVQLAQPQPQMTWMWVFQMKGAAPVARGKRLPLNSFVAGSARDTVNDTLHRFVYYWRKHGAKRPWVDGAPIVDFDDTDFPPYINA